MNVKEASKLALASLRNNKMRSALTLLGVIIGIAAVIAILTLGQSLKTNMRQSLEAVGANTITASVSVKDQDDPLGVPGMTNINDPDERLNPDMVEAVRERLGSDITGVAIGGDSYTSAGPDLQYSDALETHEKNSTSVLGVNPDYLGNEDLELVAGRLLSDDDVETGRDVAVISDELADEFFPGGPETAVGKAINSTSNDSKTPIDTDFTVIGVVKAKEEGGGLLSIPPMLPSAYIPYPALADVSAQAGAGETFGSVDILTAPDADKEDVARRVQEVFDGYYAGSENFEVKVSDGTEGMDEFNKFLTALSAGRAGIGGISLLVGGIGVMNIMLITVTERTREIGVRKALGARRRDIKWQFVIEAMIVCLVGGLIGIILGSALGMLGASLMGTFVFPPLSAVLISIGFSLAIGLFFGYYPAAKAAKLDPIDALRYE